MPHPSRQTARATEAGDQAELHLRLAEARTASGVDPVARAGELATAAEREAVHGCEGRHGQRLEGREGAVTEAAERLGLTPRPCGSWR